MNAMHVLGIGSPFGDDQAGWQVVTQLQQHKKIIALPPDLFHLECCDRPGLHLLDLLKNASTVILVDAVKTGSSVGTLHQFRNEAIEQVYAALSTHSIGIGFALKLGRELNILPKNIVLYGIEIGEIQLENNLSSPVQAAITQLVDNLLKILLLRE